jgi:hypothetical protein
MARVGIKARVHLQFNLSEDIAMWLKDLMQNPIYEDETKEEAAFRCQLFNALSCHIDVTEPYQFAQQHDDIPY